MHVEVFQVGGVGTSILGRPRPLPRYRRASPRYTLNCEEPLNRAEQKCKDDRSRIADMAVSSVQQLDERLPGHSEDTMSMLRAANESMEPLEGQTDCADIFASLVVLMVS